MTTAHLVRPVTLSGCGSKLIKLRTCKTASSRKSSSEEENMSGSLKGSLDFQILSLALPALGIQILDPLLSLADTGYVGRLGVSELGGLGLASAVFTASNSIFNFLANATAPLVAQALAQSDATTARKTTGQALVLAATLGCACCVVLEQFANPILESLSGESREQAGPVFDAAVAYLRIRAWGLPAALLCTVNGGAFRGLLDTKTPLYIAIGANSLNIILDPLLIFGFGPFPNLGVQGAALTSVFSEWVAAGTGLWMLSRSKLGLPDFFLPKWLEIEPFLKASLALFIRTVVLQSVFLLSSWTVSHTSLLEDGSLDPTKVAAHQILLQCYMFLAFIVDSIAVSAQSLVADSLGRKDVECAVLAGNRTIQYGLVAGIVLGAGLLLSRDEIPILFSPDKNVQSTVSDVLGIVAITQPLSGVAFVLDGIFIGATDFQFFAFSVVGACLLAEGALLAGGGGLSSVWVSLMLLQVGRVAGLGARYSGAFGGPFRQKEKFFGVDD